MAIFCSKKNTQPTSPPDTSSTPTIDSISIDNGTPGTEVLISGKSFGATQDSSTVTFADTIAPVTSWSDIAINATVPENTVSGEIVVTVCGKKSNGVYFTVNSSLNTPAIDSISIDNGAPGTEVLISGRNFGATPDSSTVTFSDTIAPVLSWSDTSISATVPDNAVSGDIVVTVFGQRSNGVYFTVNPIDDTPFIDSLSADTLHGGQWIDVWGRNFGNGKDNSYISIGGMIWSDSCDPGSYDGPSCWWNDHYLKGPVQVKADPGEVETTDIFVVADGVMSNVVYARLLGDPIIHDLSLDTVAYGDELQIVGELFLDCMGEVHVGGTKADLAGWSNELIIALVPQGAGPGSVSVYSLGGRADFPVRVLAIEDVNPSIAFVDDTVSVMGCGFGDDQGDSRVTLGTEEIAVLSWSDYLIRFAVTDQMSSGDVRVAVGSYESNSAYLAANSSIPDLIPYLQQTNSLKITFSGTILTTAGGTLIENISFVINPDDPCYLGDASVTSWESNDFSGTRTWHCGDCHHSERQIWIDGSAGPGGLFLDSVHCLYTYEGDEIGGGYTCQHEEEREFTLLDIPLFSKIVDGSIVISYEISGPAVQEHVANIAWSAWHYDSHGSSCDWTLDDIVWDDETNPPRFTITFRVR